MRNEDQGQESQGEDDGEGGMMYTEIYIDELKDDRRRLEGNKATLE